MQQKFSKKYLSANCGCYRDTHGRIEGLMNPYDEPITLRQIVESKEVPLTDKYWFVCKNLATKKENQQIAIHIAELVLPIFEEKYPHDKRPREAIEAAKQYLAGEISLDTLIRKRMTSVAAVAAVAYYAAVAVAAAVVDTNTKIKQQQTDYLFTFVE